MLNKIPVRRVARFFVFIFVLSIFHLSISLPCSTAAVSPNPFTDVSNSHWAVKYITKLNIREVITGYKDGSFNPDKQVTQLEALLMAVRNMDAADEIAAVDTNQTLTFSVPNWAETQYKNELLYAVQQRLIIPSDSNFSANSDASRAWMSQLIVRMMGKESEASLLAKETSNFSDYSDVPLWALGYVNTAVKYGILTGFPDNSFKPLQAVTRAQAASMLSKSEAYLNLDSITEGIILNISDSVLTVSINGAARNLYFQNNTAIFGKDSSFCTSSDLNINDKVNLISSNSQLQYLAVLDEGSFSDNLTGTVVYLISDQNLIVIKDNLDAVYSKTWDNSTICLDLSGQSCDIASIIPGTEVELTLDTQGIISTIILCETGGITGDTGILYDIVPDQQLIVLKNSSGNFKSYLYDSALAVIIDGVRFPSIDDLQIGDQVQVTASGSYISEIALVSAQQELDISGTIEVISASKRLLIIDSDGTLTTYQVADDAVISTENGSGILLSELNLDDEVDLTIKSGIITAISVSGSYVRGSHSGTIVAVDEDDDMIIFDTSKNQDQSSLETFEINAAAEIVIDDDDDCDLSDLDKEMQASFELLNGEIIYLLVDSRVSGNILTLNESRGILSIETADGDAESYLISDNVDVNIKGSSRPDLEDINKGDKVKLALDKNDVVTDIDVAISCFYTVYSVSQSSSRLKVEDEDGDLINLYLTDSVNLVVPGVSSPDIEDFEEGDTIKSTYMGNTLCEVELTEIVIGYIAAISTYNNTVSISAFDGQYYNYKFDTGCSVIDGSKTYTAISAMSADDRVKIQEDSDGDTVFYLMNKVSASFENTNLNEDKVYITQYSTSYTYYKLASSCYIHDGTLEIGISSLRMGDKIDLYMLNDLVYEIKLH